MHAMNGTESEKTRAAQETDLTEEERDEREDKEDKTEEELAEAFAKEPSYEAMEDEGLEELYDGSPDDFLAANFQ